MKSPGRSFLAGLTAWATLTVTYSVAELAFPRLGTRLSAFRRPFSGTCSLASWPRWLGNESHNQSSPSALSTAHAENRLPIKLNRSSLRPERLVQFRRALRATLIPRPWPALADVKENNGCRPYPSLQNRPY